MTRERVLVIGAGGMLGSMVARVLGEVPTISVALSTRQGPGGFDAQRDDPLALLEAQRPQWVINAAGILRSRIDERSSRSRQAAHSVNADFPHALASAAEAVAAHVVAIATDAVFSGRHGPYDEAAPHDPADVYAASKSSGEVVADHVLNLRCSIVGPENPPPRSLLGWLLQHPSGARVPGFVNRRWNGVSTLHLARVCAGIIEGEARLRGVQHLVPADDVSKADLLRMLARAFGRTDLEIVDSEAPQPADHRLLTLHPDRNRFLWAAAGYPEPPSIRTMIDELANLPR